MMKRFRVVHEIDRFATLRLVKDQAEWVRRYQSSSEMVFRSLMELRDKTKRDTKGLPLMRQ
jgi:hypothetical protein